MRRQFEVRIHAYRYNQYNHPDYMELSIWTFRKNSKNYKPFDVRILSPCVVDLLSRENDAAVIGNFMHQWLERKIKRKAVKTRF